MNQMLTFLEVKTFRYSVPKSVSRFSTSKTPHSLSIPYISTKENKEQMERAIFHIDILIAHFDSLEESKHSEETGDHWLKRYWTRYPSIISPEKELKEIRDLGLTQNNIKWAVTEKVHGANFCIAFNGRQLAAAKLTNQKVILLISTEFS